MMDANDWRIANVPVRLRKAVLQRANYVQPSATWDHDHCTCCWQKIAEPHIEEALHDGYVTLAGADWICPECFVDLSLHFAWTLQAAPND
jgi:hypothetical protein